MSETFIIDEWFWADLNGENGVEKQRETSEFIDLLFKRCDRIVVARDSEFQQKEWEFSKKAIDVTKRGIARLYFGKIKFNSQKYEDVDIRNIREADLEDIDSDDIYLVKTCCKVNAPIITTDNSLINALKSKDISCSHRDEFLRGYFKNA